MTTPRADLRALGLRIAQERHARGWSIEKLAETAGVGRLTIITTEQGQKEPRLATVHAIAHALGIPVGDLVAVICARHSGSGVPSQPSSEIQ